jgi:septal ring factor EnvC (AmiA/AmiB activator)
VRVGAALAALLAALAATAGAQQSAEARLRAERERLETIRRERAELERQMKQLQGTVHDLSAEVRNLDRQADATERLVRSLDEQLASITGEVETATVELSATERQLGDARGSLRRRLISIYKRGPVRTYEALLTADSFGQLVARYKYLRLLADRDRALVGTVQTLRDKARKQRANLVRFQQAIELARSEKVLEERRLRELEGKRQRNLSDTRKRAAQVAERIKRIQRDEARLNNVLASLEAARKRAERAAPNAPRASSTLRTSDLGRLDWPVEGTIIYNFGRVVNPNNTTTRWNGIGIAASTGTPVKTVAAGKVVVAQPFGTYGQTIIIQHGGGDYSVYGSLSELRVREGAVVSKGQVIGTVGAADPELEPHLHFEMRPQGRAVDPLEWLRGQR